MLLNIGSQHFVSCRYDVGKHANLHANIVDCMCYLPQWRESVSEMQHFGHRARVNTSLSGCTDRLDESHLAPLQEGDTQLLPAA
jgi:hypothetical protein